jgi:hypothetical protein
MFHQKEIIYVLSRLIVLSTTKLHHHYSGANSHSSSSSIIISAFGELLKSTSLGCSLDVMIRYVLHLNCRLFLGGDYMVDFVDLTVD